MGDWIKAFGVILGIIFIGSIFVMGGLGIYNVVERQASIGITISELQALKQKCEETLPRKKECAPYVKFVIRDKPEKLK